jgi:quercetin dioxygenase-like cupin family protein
MTRTFWMFGTRLTIHADHDATAGRYDLVEGHFPPGVETPPHRHTRYSELLYTIKGQLTVWVEGRTVAVPPAESLLVPAGAAHAVGATGPTRSLAVASPSGFASLIAAVGTPDPETGDPPPPDAIDVATFERLSAEIGDEVLGPPGSRPPPGA